MNFIRNRSKKNNNKQKTFLLIIALAFRLGKCGFNDRTPPTVLIAMGICHEELKLTFRAALNGFSILGKQN